MEKSTSVSGKTIRANEVPISFTKQSEIPLTGSWEFDLQSKHLQWSDSQYLIYGYEPQEVQIVNDFFIFKTTHYSEIDRISKIVNDALQNDSAYSFKRRIIKKNGTIGFVETKASIIRDDSRCPVKIKGITIDLSRPHNEEAAEFNHPSFFNHLFKNYSKNINYEVLKFVFDKDIAEDLCQEIFLKAWNNMSRFDPKKGALYTWLINIARNHCKDYLKSKYHKIHKVSAALENSTAENMHCSFINTSTFEVNTLLKNLPAEQRELLDLLFIKGYSQQEAAYLKKMPLGTIKTKSRCAIKKLQKLVSIKEQRPDFSLIRTAV